MTLAVSGSFPVVRHAVNVDFEAVVAEQHSPLVNELSYRGNVSVPVHDGQLRARQPVDERQHMRVPQVVWAADDFGEVTGDEQRRVAVLFVGGISGQADDAVVRNTTVAGDIQRLHLLKAI